MLYVHSMTAPEAKEEEEDPIFGDVLELIFSRVPLIDLVPACHVSKSWKSTISSSLSNFNSIKPWLLVHVQNTRSLIEKTVHAYDPRSDIWIQIDRPMIRHNSAVRSSGSTLLYALSSSKLSVSVDPLHLTWVHMDAPRVWRVDPAVALVGSHIVVAGGGCEFEDDPLAVEMYDVESSQWSTCQSMPVILKDSAASTWLSVAANTHKMYVTEKASGITYSFNPSTKTWQGPYDLRPDPRVFFSAVGFAGDDLILTGLIGHTQNVETLKLWRVELETLRFSPIAEIPSIFMEKLKGENSSMPSISMSATEGFVYIYNPAAPAEVVYCEVSGAGDFGGRWGSVRNAAVKGESGIVERMVVTCGRVEIWDLEWAMRSQNCRFLVNL